MKLTLRQDRIEDYRLFLKIKAQCPKPRPQDNPRISTKLHYTLLEDMYPYLATKDDHFVFFLHQ